MPPPAVDAVGDDATAVAVGDMPAALLSPWPAVENRSVSKGFCLISLLVVAA